MVVRKPTPQKAVSVVCGLTDPFCKHAMGSKYPDDSSVRTLPYTFRGRSTIATGADGTSSRLWNPQYAFAPLTSAGAGRVGPIVAGWNNFAAVGLISGVSKYRIVSSGFTLKSICAPLYASGEVAIRDFGVPTSSLDTVDLLTYNATSTSNIPLRSMNNVAVITSHNSAMPQTFYPVSSDSASPTTPPAGSFNPVTIYVTGAPASTDVLVIEYVIHYELIFDDSSGMAQVATPPPTRNPALTMVANQVTSSAGTIFESGVSAAGRYIENIAARAIGTFLGGPAGGQLAVGGLSLVRDVD